VKARLPERGNGIVYVVLSFTGVLWPEWQHKVFVCDQPAMFGEMVLMFWLVVKGVMLSEQDAVVS